LDSHSPRLCSSRDPPRLLPDPLSRAVNQHHAAMIAAHVGMMLPREASNARADDFVHDYVIYRTVVFQP
jgi:hypothetical protein